MKLSWEKIKWKLHTKNTINFNINLCLSQHLWGLKLPKEFCAAISSHQFIWLKSIFISLTDLEKIILKKAKNAISNFRVFPCKNSLFKGTFKNQKSTYYICCFRIFQYCHSQNNSTLGYGNPWRTYFWTFCSKMALV